MDSFKRDELIYEFRKLLKNKKAVLLIVIGAVLLVGLVIFALLRSGIREEAPEETPTVTLPDRKGSRTATLSAVGDLMIDENLLRDAKQANGSYDFISCFLPSADLLTEADLTVGNLEMTFSGEPYGGQTYSAPESLAETLKIIGFDILQTGNSKTLAGGLAGLGKTLDTLHAEGLETVGSYASRKERHDCGSVLLKEVNGIRIAFIAFTKGFDGMTIPNGHEYCADLLYTDYNTQYNTVDRSGILSVVDNAKAENPDIIVAMLHWGSSYKIAVSESQKKIANLLLENGVDVILGSHSHAVGPMELRSITAEDGSERQGFVAYSLGNFLSTDTESYAQESLVLNLEFSKDDETGEAWISGIEYVPVYLVDNGKEASNRYQTLDLYRAIELYHTTYYQRVSERNYQRLLEAIDDLKYNTGTDFDRGPATG